MSWYISNALKMAYENSLCSQERAAESSEENFSDGEPSAPSKSTNTQGTSSCSDRMTGVSNPSLSGMTSPPSMEPLGVDVLTWFLGDFLALSQAHLSLRGRDSSPLSLYVLEMLSSPTKDDGVPSWPSCEKMQRLFGAFAGQAYLIHLPPQSIRTTSEKEEESGTTKLVLMNASSAHRRGKASNPLTETTFKVVFSLTLKNTTERPIGGGSLVDTSQTVGGWTGGEEKAEESLSAAESTSEKNFQNASHALAITPQKSRSEPSSSFISQKESSTKNLQSLDASRTEKHSHPPHYALIKNAPLHCGMGGSLEMGGGTKGGHCGMEQRSVRPLLLAWLSLDSAPQEELPQFIPIQYPRKASSKDESLIKELRMMSASATATEFRFRRVPMDGVPSSQHLQLESSRRSITSALPKMNPMSQMAQSCITVKTSQWPKQMPLGFMGRKADYGPTWLALSVRFDRNTSSWRTLPCSEVVDSKWFSKTLPKWGMMRGGELWALTTSAHPTNETGCGLWRPPQASEGERGVDSTPALTDNRIKRGKQIFLSHQVKHKFLWRTPRAADESDDRSPLHEKYLLRVGQGKFRLGGQVKDKALWPTPTVHGNYNRVGVSANSGDGLATAVKWRTPCVQEPGLSIERLVTADGKKPTEENLNQRLYDRETGRLAQIGVTQQVLLYERSLLRKGNRLNGEQVEFFDGSLNPDWVEWLMGWPIFWTKVDFALLNPTIEDWAHEPTDIPRVTKEKYYRISARQRIKCLGNGQVPLCAAVAFELLRVFPRPIESKDA